MNEWFDAEYLHHGVTWIDEPHVHPAGNIWLLSGDTADLVVDTGCGVRDLNQYVSGLTSRPYTAVATVGYFDHAGGLHQFEHTAIHHNDAHRIASPNAQNSIWGKYVIPERFKSAPHEAFSAEGYGLPPHDPSRLLDDGDVIEFGNRALEVVHLPGVTDGSIGLFERNTSFLFTGDFLLDTDPAYIGEPANESDDADLHAFLSSLDKVEAMPIAEVFPGHGSPYDAPRLKQVIRDCRDAAQAALT